MKNSNMEKSNEAQVKVIEVLSDGKWHQTKNLKVETRVSSRTLYKHLEKLKRWIDEREDRKSGKYPYPKYYRANSVRNLRSIRKRSSPR